MLDDKAPYSVDYTYGRAMAAADAVCAAVVVDAASDYGSAAPSLAERALAFLPQGLALFDTSQTLRLANDRFAAVVGLASGALPLGLSFRECWRRILASTSDAGFRPWRAERAYRRHREIVRRKADATLVEIVGPDLALEVSYRAMPDGAFVVTFENVTRERRVLQRMAELAARDPLTDLANRKTFRERLAHALKDPRRAGRLALVQIDLDRFKLVNDALGHQAGDRLLRIAAQRIGGLLPPGGFAARLGGDEFALVLEGMEEIEVATLCERIVGALSAPVALGLQNAEVGASVGIAFAALRDAGVDELMLSADLALYSAKSAGGSIVSVYTDEMADQFKGRMLLEAELRVAALTKAGLSLLYQPISDARTGRVTAREALMRWSNPRLGPISPCTFIPIAEQLGVIAEIGAWALKHACLDAARWPDKARVAVNVSPHQLGRGQLVEHVLEALVASGLSPDRLEVEITETALLSDDAAKLGDLSRLHDIGVRVALDDFGTGFSSLAHVRAFPFDKIKVDGSFVRDAVERPDCAVIVGIVAELGRRLSMTVVAEGVETEAHLALARAQGCDEIQGYLLGRPVAQADIVFDPAIRAKNPARRSA